MFFDFGPIRAPSLVSQSHTFRQCRKSRFSSYRIAYLEAWHGPGKAEFSNPVGVYSLFKNCAICKIRGAKLFRRIHVFTTKNAYSALLVAKVRQNWPACHRAVWPRILEVEKVYRTCVKLHMLMLSRSYLRRYFEFQTGFVVFLWLRTFAEIDGAQNVEFHRAESHAWRLGSRRLGQNSVFLEFRA